MAERLGQAILELATDDRKLRKGLAKGKAAAQKFGASMKSVGQDLSLKLTAPIVAFGALSLKAAGDFEAGMNQVKAVSGATEEQFISLREQAKELGATTQFSASEAAAGMGFLAQAGFEANEILSAMPGTLQLASAAQLELGEAADIVSNILTGYRLDVEDLNRVNDVLVKAFTSSNTNLQDLGQAMKFAGPVASAAGVGFEEAAAALGLMGNAGIQASMAGTSLRGVISRILNPTKKAAGIMKDLGLKFTDVNGRLIPLNEIIQQLEKHSDDAGLFMQLFGQRAGPAMAALVAQGSDALVKFTEDLKNSGGTAERIAKVQMAGFNGAMKEMKSAFEAVQIALGDSGLLDFMAKLVRRLAAGFRAASLANPELLKIGIVVAGLAAVIGPALIVLGQLSIAFGALLPGILALKVGLIGVFLGPAAPFLLLAAAVTLWISDWERLKADTLFILRNLTTAVKIQMELMKGVMLQVARVATLGVSDLFLKMFDTIVGNSIVPRMMDRLADDFGGMEAMMEKKTIMATSSVKEAFAGMGTSIAGDLGTLGSQLFQSAISFEQFAERAVSALARLAIQQAATFAGGPGGAFLGSFFGGFFEHGGNPPSGLPFVAGEAGPELISRRGPVTVTPLAAGAGGGGINITNNFPVTDLANSENVARIMRTATRELKSGARDLLRFARVSGDRDQINNRRAS